MRKIVFFTLYCIFFSATVCHGRQENFSATLVETGDFETKQSKLSVSGEKYRIDLQEDGTDIFLLVDLASKETRIVTPAYKNFVVTDYNDIAALVYDPFAVVRNQASQHTIKNEGEETINGMVCEKRAVDKGDQRLITYFHSKSLDFPIRIINHLRNDLVFELRDISNSLAESVFFTVPEEYQRELTPWQVEEQIEASLSILSTSEILDAPMGRRLSTGAELRINLKSWMTAELEVENIGLEEAKVIMTPFRQGKFVECAGENLFVRVKKGEPQKRVFNHVTPKFEEECRVEEVKLSVETGLIYATAFQRGTDENGTRILEYYNGGIGTMDIKVTQTRGLVVSVTGATPDFPRTTGRVFAKTFDKIIRQHRFTLQNGETTALEIDKQEKAASVLISIKKGDGGATIRLAQPLPEEGLRQNVFLAQEMYEMEVVPNKDLLISITGRGGGTKGRLVLSQERFMKKKVEEIDLSLKSMRVVSSRFSKESRIRYLFFNVTAGALSVTVDQTEAQPQDQQDNQYYDQKESQSADKQEREIPDQPEQPTGGEPVGPFQTEKTMDAADGHISHDAQPGEQPAEINNKGETGLVPLQQDE